MKGENMSDSNLGDSQIKDIAAKLENTGKDDLLEELTDLSLETLKQLMDHYGLDSANKVDENDVLTDLWRHITGNLESGNDGKPDAPTGEESNP